MGHPGQGICERFWGDITNIGNFMELKINQTYRKEKELRECENVGSGQVQSAEARASPKGAGKG
jgi:hypothetical protein